MQSRVLASATRCDRGGGSIPTQSLRHRRRNPRLLQSLSGFSVFKLYFATFARAVSTSDGLTLRTLGKGCSKSVTICVRHKICRECRVLSPPHEAASGICLPMQVPTASLLTRSMIVSTPVLATPVRGRPGLVSHSCKDVISDQGS